MKSKPILMLAIAWSCTITEAHAQVWGYSPYTGSATWLGLARTLSYPLNRFSSAGMPLYLANNLIYAGTYAANNRILNRQRDFNYGVYTDEEPYYNPRRRTRATMNGGYGVNDQIVHAQPYRQPQSDAEFDDTPPPTINDPSQDFNIDPRPIVANNGNAAAPNMIPHAVAPTRSDIMPPLAPSRAASGASQPLAEGFVQVLNDRFGGDIVQALADKDTCKYAKAIGLIDGKPNLSSISGEKRDLIRAIMSDGKEPLDVRINAVRVLLKH